MTSKVTESWLLKNGWTKTADETETKEECRTYTSARRNKVFEYCPQPYIRARIDHSVYTSQFNSDGALRTRSSYYIFYGSNRKTGFIVENRISHRRFSISAIESALALLSD